MIPLCHTNCNPFRYFAVRVGCVLVGLGIALVIGVVLFNNSLQSSRQEFDLKCDNIKEVRPANPSMTLEKLKNFDGSRDQKKVLKLGMRFRARSKRSVT